MTTTQESAAELREALNGTRARLADLEERHEAAIGKIGAARQERAAALLSDPGYHPELASAVHLAEAERDTIADAIATLTGELSRMKARLRAAENRETQAQSKEREAEAVAAWTALDTELMKHASRLSKLHHAAIEATFRAPDSGGAIDQASPGLRGVMRFLAPYLSGELLKDRERERERREHEAAIASERAKKQAADDAEVRQWQMMPVEERNRITAASLRAG